MNGAASECHFTDLQQPSSMPLMTNRRTLIRAAVAFTVAGALLGALLLELLHAYPPGTDYRPAVWMVALRSAFVLPPLLLFTSVVARVAFIPKRMFTGALTTTLGLTLWMTYELASVLFAAPDARGLAVELAIDALVVTGITTYLYGGLLEHRHLTSRAERDPLTGLLNRNGANRAWDALAPGTRVTLAVIDLNELKAVNDLYGHEAGDNLILACAHELRAIRGSTGFAARWGGDEFLLALPDLTPDQTRERLASAETRVNISIGELPVWAVGTTRATAGSSLQETMQPADAHMYQRKAEQYRTANTQHRASTPPASPFRESSRLRRLPPRQ